jgi:hypothetical protein
MQPTSKPKPQQPRKPVRRMTGDEARNRWRSQSPHGHDEVEVEDNLDRDDVRELIGHNSRHFEMRDE